MSYAVKKKSKITFLSCQLKIVLIEEVNKVSDSRSENVFCTVEHKIA